MKVNRLIPVLAALALAGGLAGQVYKVAVPQLSPTTIDIYTKLATALVEATGNKAEIQVLPFARCIYSIENKLVDMVAMTVALPDQKKWAALGYDYSTSEAFKLVFVLYTNKAKPIDVAELKKGNPKGYRLETDSAHTAYFPFAISPSTSFEASLRKVDSGDIDGYIFAQPSADGVVRSAGLKNIYRQYYDSFSAMFLIQKGARGGKMDALITDGLTKIKASGKYLEIMATYLAGASVYIEWQP
jgi:ABC-type amino acid transport substrate-binding protein